MMLANRAEWYFGLITNEEWQDYFENPDEAEIYGFELDDGEVQMAILDCFIKEPDENQPLGE